MKLDFDHSNCGFYQPYFTFLAMNLIITTIIDNCKYVTAKEDLLILTQDELKKTDDSIYSWHVACYQLLRNKTNKKTKKTKKGSLKRNTMK